MTDSTLPEDFKPLHGSPQQKPKRSWLDWFYVWIIAVGVGGVVVCYLCGCAGNTTAPEFTPVMYIPMDNGTFQNPTVPTDVIDPKDCKDAKGAAQVCRFNQSYLTPVDQVTVIQSLLNQCAVWK